MFLHYGNVANILSLPHHLHLKMKYLLQISIYLFCLNGLHSQSEIDRTLNKFNTNSVPYITVERLLGSDQFLLLDTREKGEFGVSRLPKALWVGHKNLDMDKILTLVPDKNTPIVVYCSVGIRSETVGERLIKEGYTEVYNLYGGIFEWKNRDYPVYDTMGKETDKVHAYNKHWGKMLNNAIKVYGNRKQND
jgi:rhodanese-related sulfurtransferase